MDKSKYNRIITDILEDGGVTLSPFNLLAPSYTLHIWMIGGATDEIHIDMDYHERDENRDTLNRLRDEILEIDLKIAKNPFHYFEDIELHGVYFGGWRYLKDRIDLLIFEGAYAVKDTYQAIALAKRLNQKEIYHLGLKQYLSIKKLEELMGGLS